MRLNNGTISFNLDITEGGGNPSWGTELGQNQKYNYSVPGVEKLITSMLYSKIDEKAVTYNKIKSIVIITIHIAYIYIFDIITIIII